MIGANDPVRKATGGLLDLDEIIAVAFLFCLLVFVTGAGVDPEPQTKCAPVINPQAGNQRQLPARNPTRTYTRSGAWALD